MDPLVGRMVHRPFETNLAALKARLEGRASPCARARAAVATGDRLAEICGRPLVRRATGRARGPVIAPRGTPAGVIAAGAWRWGSADRTCRPDLRLLCEMRSGFQDGDAEDCGRPWSPA